MFSWVSCWNSMKSPFILPAVCPWSLWGVESRGIPKPSPLGLPTASRHLISAETWSGERATASAARRRGPSHSHSQLAAGNREYLRGGGGGTGGGAPASPTPRKEVEWGGGQVGSSYLGLGSSYLLGGCPRPPDSKLQCPLLNKRIATESHKIGPLSLFPEPGTLATSWVPSGHPFPLLGLCLPRVSSIPHPKTPFSEFLPGILKMRW